MSYETQDEITEVLNIIKNFDSSGGFFDSIFKKCRVVYEKNKLAKILHNQIELGTVHKDKDTKKYIYTNLQTEKINDEIKKLLANNEQKQMEQECVTKTTPKIVTVHRDKIKTEKEVVMTKVEEQTNSVDNSDNRGKLSKNSISGKIAYIFLRMSQLNKRCPYLCSTEIKNLLDNKANSVPVAINYLLYNNYIVKQHKIGKLFYYTWNKNVQYPFSVKSSNDDDTILTKEIIEYLKSKEIINKHSIETCHIKIEQNTDNNLDEKKNVNISDSETVITKFIPRLDTNYVFSIDNIPAHLKIKTNEQLFIDNEISILEYKLNQLKNIKAILDKN